MSGRVRYEGRPARKDHFRNAHYVTALCNLCIVRSAARSGGAVILPPMRARSTARLPSVTVRADVGNPGQGERDSGMIPNGVPG